MSKRITTFPEFTVYLDREVAKLFPAYEHDFLNYQGKRTFEALRELANLASFHPTFKSFFEDSMVQDVLLRNYEIKRVKETFEFLEKKAKAEGN